MEGKFIKDYQEERHGLWYLKSINGSWDNALWCPRHKLFPGPHSRLLLETTDGATWTFPSTQYLLSPLNISVG